MPDLRIALAAGLCLFGFASAASADELVIYTPQGAEHTQVLEKAFEERHPGIDLKIVNMGGGEVHDRVLAERNNPQADVIFGLIDLLSASLKAQGVLQPYTVKALDGLPDIYKDPDGYFYGYRQTPITLSYNTNCLSPETAPTAWEDLSDPKWKGKFAVGSLTSQTTRALLAGLFTRQIDEKGDVTDAGWDWFKAFYSNALILKDSSLRPAQIASCETPLSLNHFLGVQGDAGKGGYPYAYINTAGGTPVVVERNSILAGTKRMASALTFLEFAQSVEWQVMQAEMFGVIPVHPDAIAKAPEKVRNSATLLTPQPINWDLMASKLDGWIERIQLDLL